MGLDWLGTSSLVKLHDQQTPVGVLIPVHTEFVVTGEITDEKTLFVAHLSSFNTLW